MNLLLDSHCLLWWLADRPLREEASAAIGEPANSVYVSAASTWELEIQAALDKLTIDGDLLVETEAAGLSWLPITPQHARAATRLPLQHRDPFDRILIAQALREGLTIVTRDPVFTEYAVPVLMA